MNVNIKKLKRSLVDLGLDAFLVTKDINISYLTGFPSSDSWLLVSPRGVFYITDFRYILEAKKNLSGITIKRHQGSLSQMVVDLAVSLKIKRIGMDDRHLSWAAYQQLKKRLPWGIRIVSTGNVVEDLRQVKTTQEKAKILKAISLNQKAYHFLKGVIKPGLTEQEVLLKLENYIKGFNVKFSFDPIIASGPNSCFPHARVTGRKIQRNDLVLVDVGIDVEGYKSDLTRMFFLGKIPRPIYDVYNIVCASQHAAIQKIKPGIPASEVDQEARNYLKKNKLDKFFGHSLGHGVGLEIHEEPSISSKSSTPLQAGMIFTVEPAVYIPGKFGIRIEDMVLVTKKGYEVLSDYRN